MLQPKLTIVIILFWAFQFHANAQSDYSNPIDSLKQVLENPSSDTVLVWVYRDLAYYYLNLDLDTAVLFAQKGFDVAKKSNHTQGKIWNLYQKALALEYKDEFDGALKAYFDALQLAQHHKDSLSQAKLFNALGAAYYFQHQLDQSIQYYNFSYIISEKIGYHEGLAFALNNMGIIYRHRRNFKKALDTYQKSLQLKIQENDTLGIFNSYYNLALLHSYQLEYDKSLAYFNKAKELEQVSNLPFDKAPLQIGMGVAHYHLGQDATALDYLANGLEHLGKNNTYEKIAALIYRGILTIKVYQQAKGLNDLWQAKSALKNSGRLELKRMLAKEMALAHELLNQTDSSLHYMKMYSHLNDSILNEQQLWAIEEMQAKYEISEKNTVIEQQSAIITNINRQRNYWIAATILLVLIASVIIRNKGKSIRSIQSSEPQNTRSQLLNLEKLNNLSISPFTQREQEIIQLIYQGCSNKEISERLFISTNTVKAHLKNIFSKMNAKNRTDLIFKIQNN